MPRSARLSKLACFATLAALVMTATPARAVNVTLNVTNGSFTSNAPNVDVLGPVGLALNGFNPFTSSGISVEPSPNSIFAPDLVLAFTTFNLLNTTYNEPTVVDLGAFTINVPEDILFSNNRLYDVDGNDRTTTFSVTVNQSQPAAGSQSLTTDLSGTVTRSSDNVTGGQVAVNFAQTSFTIGGVLYELLGLNGTTLFLNPGTVNQNGVTNLTARISAVPEPATMAVAFSGLATLGLYGLRRTRRKGSPVVA